MNEREIGDIRIGRRMLPEMHGEVSFAVRMIFGDFQPERQELHHPVSVDVAEPPGLRGEQERRRMTEGHKPGMAGNTHFAVYPPGDVAGSAVLLAESVGGA